MAAIAKIEAWIVEEPINVGSASFGISTSYTVIARVADVDEVSGFAYAYQFRGGYARALVALIEEMSADVVGRDAHDAGAVWHQIERDHLDFLGSSGSGRVAQSVLDMALWDLRCKGRGVTLTEMMGPVRDSCDVYSGVSGGGDADALRHRAIDAVSEGFTSLKVGALSSDVVQERERVAAVRDAIGPDVGLIVDSFRRLDAGTAVEFGRMLEEFDLLWWEDPVPRDDLDGLRELGAHVCVPLALGEDAYSIADFRRLIETDSVSYVLIDLQRAGGITGWNAIAEMADAHGQRVAPHMFTHIGRHLVACTANAVIVEYQPFWDQLFGPVVSDGRLLTSTEPGIGLHVPTSMLNVLDM